ncbi:MAG: aromatic ring-hydroxylating dioxygenase subunit alpha [Proteobacteria bacterium]|nr:aromatic ring-hydroxylating dioxygenase subunit alpha [Pseudomonadota bacterium]MBS0573088.1 aromatic ring-hydroxylating dioxygenase subunit alpha [Pseudomonadota bacterium]
MTRHQPPASPLLDHCPPTLPGHAYHSADWFAQEQRTIWARNWVAAGRLADLMPGSMRRLRVGAASVILCRATDGGLSAFHNVCRHRGAELCGQDAAPLGRLIACPYHAWSYAACDGHLVATGHACPTSDFRREDHGLLPVAVTVWSGFVLVNLSRDPGPLHPDMGLGSLDNWPMADLVTGHRIVRDLACNWKVFWENYNECLHCPGIHPELCDMVPVYGRGLMAADEAPERAPDTGGRVLREGAVSWTPDGQPCGPEFPGLTPEERQNGFNFVTLYPAMYVVAHVDHVRAVRLEPTGPESTRLTAEWYFPAGTLARPGFDAAEIASFATLVIDQDGAAAEMNQRGLRSPAYQRGRLMPEEYAIADFHAWVLGQMAEEEQG